MIGKIKYLLIATFAIAFITYSFWSVIKEQYGVRVFYPGIALSFVGYTYIIHLLIKLINFEKRQKRILLIISSIIFLITVNNLIDELFFNPTVTSFNEYIGFILIIGFTIHNYNKNE